MRAADCRPPSWQRQARPPHSGAHLCRITLTRCETPKALRQRVSGGSTCAVAGPIAAEAEATAPCRAKAARRASVTCSRAFICTRMHSAPSQLPPHGQALQSVLPSASAERGLPMQVCSQIRTGKAVLQKGAGDDFGPAQIAPPAAAVVSPRQLGLCRCPREPQLRPRTRQPRLGPGCQARLEATWRHRMMRGQASARPLGCATVVHRSST